MEKLAELMDRFESKEALVETISNSFELHSIYDLVQYLEDELEYSGL